MESKQKVVAKHKELLSGISECQNAIDDMCGNNGIGAIINDEAYRQLANTNQALYQRVQALIEDVKNMKVVYEREIIMSRWRRDYVDEAYRLEMARERERKLQDTSKVTCECGDRLAKSYIYTHKKTDKCASARLRLKWKTDELALNKKYITAGLVANSLFNSYSNDKKRYSKACLRSLVIKYKENKRRLSEIAA